MQIEIKIKGILSQQWTDWFNNLDIAYDGNNTILKGHIVDESALHGLLNQIRDLNIKLIHAQIIEE